MKIELYEEDWECHSCGIIGNPRYLIHLDHLCQHAVSLCKVCFKRLVEIVSKVPTRRGEKAK